MTEETDWSAQRFDRRDANLTRASLGPDEIEEYAFVVVPQIRQVVGEVGEVGVWVVQYRDRFGEMIVEPTKFPANTPSIVVSDELQKERPEFAVFAKIN